MLKGYVFQNSEMYRGELNDYTNYEACPIPLNNIFVVKSVFLGYRRLIFRIITSKNRF